jgi:hypothetical protein
VCVSECECECECVCVVQFKVGLLHNCCVEMNMATCCCCVETNSVPILQRSSLFLVPIQNSACVCHYPVRATLLRVLFYPDWITIVFREEYGHGAPH